MTFSKLGLFHSQIHDVHCNTQTICHSNHRFLKFAKSWSKVKLTIGKITNVHFKQARWESLFHSKVYIFWSCCSQEGEGGGVSPFIDVRRDVLPIWAIFLGILMLTGMGAGPKFMAWYRDDPIFQLKFHQLLLRPLFLLYFVKVWHSALSANVKFLGWTSSGLGSRQMLKVSPFWQESTHFSPAIDISPGLPILSYKVPILNHFWPRILLPQLGWYSSSFYNLKTISI